MGNKETATELLKTVSGRVLSSGICEFYLFFRNASFIFISYLNDFSVETDNILCCVLLYFGQNFIDLLLLTPVMDTKRITQVIDILKGTFLMSKVKTLLFYISFNMV